LLSLSLIGFCLQLQLIRAEAYIAQSSSANAMAATQRRLRLAALPHDVLSDSELYAHRPSLTAHGESQQCSAVLWLSLTPPFFFAVPHLSDGVRHARPQNGAEPAGDGEHGIVHMQDGSLLPVLRDLENEVSEIRVKLDLAPVSLPFYTTVPFRYQSV
jgi:hypothetical protein